MVSPPSHPPPAENLYIFTTASRLEQELPAMIDRFLDHFSLFLLFALLTGPVARAEGFEVLMFLQHDPL